jgi:hypothetical protein
MVRHLLFEIPNVTAPNKPPYCEHIARKASSLRSLLKSDSQCVELTLGIGSAEGRADDPDPMHPPLRPARSYGAPRQAKRPTGAAPRRRWLWQGQIVTLAPALARTLTNLGSQGPSLSAAQLLFRQGSPPGPWLVARHRACCGPRSYSGVLLKNPRADKQSGVRCGSCCA